MDTIGRCDRIATGRDSEQKLYTSWQCKGTPHGNDVRHAERFTTAREAEKRKVHLYPARVIAWQQTKTLEGSLSVGSRQVI